MNDEQRLHDAVESFADLALAAPRAPQRPGGWGVREVLAHLVHWHEHYVRIVRAQLRGQAPELPEGTFNQLNASAVANLRAMPLAELARRFRGAQLELDALAPEARHHHLEIQIKAGARRWPWAEFVRRVTGHVNGHRRELARARRS